MRYISGIITSNNNINIMEKKFKFYIPEVNIEKGGKDKSGKDLMIVSGICSTNDEDSDGENLEPIGFNTEPLLKSGFINWNHQAKKDPSAIIGEPIEAKVVDGNKLFIKAVLYNNSKLAKSVYDKINELKDADSTRKIGWSIEGIPTLRDKVNPKRILKANITGVAITHCPKNAHTAIQIVKGEYDEEEEEQFDEEDILGKAMEAEPDLTHESVEGFPKKKNKLKTDEDVENNEERNKNKLFSKSEVLSKFMKNLPNQKTETYKSIFDSFNTKILNQMEDITQEKIEKAIEDFSMLLKGENLNVEEETEIEKGGEGSKGGKVIGHTKSGKPIYANKSANHKDYKDFSEQDHKDAYKLHDNLSGEYDNKNTKSVSYSDKANFIKNRDNHADKAVSHINKFEKSEEDTIEKGELIQEFSPILTAASEMYSKMKVSDSELAFDELTEGLIRDGYSLAESSKTAQQIIEEFSKNNNGGETTAVNVEEITTSLKKSFDERFDKLEKSFDEKLLKIVEDVLKPISKSNANNLLQIKEVEDKIEKSLSVSNGRKSIVGATGAIIERFEKGQSGEKINLNTEKGVNQLKEVLDVEFQKSHDDDLMDAMFQLEGAKMITPALAQKLRGKGINI